MRIRAATKEDLPALEEMFDGIVESMCKNGIAIWNEFYPYEEFETDIHNENFYLIIGEGEILAAFGIYESVSGKDSFEWTDKKARAVYLGRVGVNVKHLRKGIGERVLKHASEIAKQRNAKFLRLLVSDINQPAIRLYEKNGFNQVAGQFNEFSEALNKTITELGYEKEGD